MSLENKLPSEENKGGDKRKNSLSAKIIIYSLTGVLAIGGIASLKALGDDEQDYCCKSTTNDCVACCPSSAPYYASGAKKCYETLTDCMKASKTSPGMCYPCTGDPCPLPPKEQNPSK